MTPIETTPDSIDMTPDSDDVLTAFSEARAAAPDDRALLRAWTTRFPQFADDLMTLDFARAANGMTLSEALREDAPEDSAIVALGREYLSSRAAPRPLSSLVGEAAAQGLDVPQLAARLRLDRLLLSRLEQRALDTASLPRSLAAQLAQVLGRSTDEIIAYLQARPRLASQAHFKAQKAPSLVAEPGMPRQTFADALQIGQTLTDEDRAYWQAEIEAGVLGDI